MAKLKTIIGPPLVRCPECESTRTKVLQKQCRHPATRRRICMKCRAVFNVEDPSVRLSNMFWAGLRVIMDNYSEISKNK